MNRPDPGIIQWEREKRSPIVESLFIKFLVPESDLAVWLRYTITNTQTLSHGAVWAVVTDAARTIAMRQSYPVDAVVFSKSRFFLKIGDSHVSTGLLEGSVRSNGHKLSWHLGYETPSPAFLHLPLRALYHEKSPFPEVKLASPYVDTRFYGTLTLDGQQVQVRAAPGMVGHNWTRSHFPASWIWLHCNVFDSDPDACLEVAASRVHPGLPFMATGFLRLGGHELVFNDPVSLLRNRVRPGEPMQIVLRKGMQAVKATVRNAPGIRLCYVAPDNNTGVCTNTPHAGLQLAFYNINPRNRGPYLALRSQNCTLELFESGPCDKCVLDDRIHPTPHGGEL